MALNLKKPAQKANLKADQVVFTQGQVVDGLVMLHQGCIELFVSFDDNYSPDNESELNETVRKILTLNDNMICGDLPLFLNIPAPYTAKAAKDSIISIFPLPADRLPGTIIKKPNIGFMIAKSLLRQLLESVKNLQDKNQFLIMLQKKSLNLGLSFYKLNSLRFIKKSENTALPAYLEEIESRVKVLFNEGGSLPEQIDANFLRGDHAAMVGISYGFRSEGNPKLVSFYRRFFSLPPAYQTQFFEKHYDLLVYVCEELSRELEKQMKGISHIDRKIDQAMQDLIGAELSLFNEYYDLYSRNSAEPDPLRKSEINISFRYLMDQINTFMGLYERSMQQSFGRADSKIDSVHENFAEEERLKEAAKAKQKEAEDNPSVISSVADSNEELIQGELRDSMGQIMAYSGLESDKVKKFKLSWTEFQGIKNKLDTDSGIRKLRRQISRLYWEIYDKSMQKYIASRQCPKAVSLMFRFGFFDENALEPDQIGAIYRFQDHHHSRFSIIEIPQWLERIYHEKENTSITELGQTYHEILRTELRGMDNATISKMDRFPNDTRERRLSFEIDHMLSFGSVTAAGSIGQAFPILIKDLLPGHIKDQFVTKEKITSTVQEILDVDFSLFYREVIMRTTDGKKEFNEFVRKEIMPHFLILPTVGLKAAMWQELDGRSKESKARFLLPSFFIGNFKEMLLEAFGIFRWEIVRTIAGAGWADPTSGLLTADYFDYQEFFKKNKNLSSEAKEKLSAEFKKFRDPRSRFVNDYMHWMHYEYEGIPKMNKVARDIFIRHVPFPKAKRQELYNFPAYNASLNRYENITKKKRRELENRYAKYTKDGQEMPAELAENLKLLDY